MKCPLGISNFLEEISSLSHSVVFLYFFALIARKAFLSLLAILWNSAFRCLYLSFSPLLFASLLFSILDWKIPWTEEAGGLQSMGSQRVRHDWAHYCSSLLFAEKQTYKWRFRCKLRRLSLCIHFLLFLPDSMPLKLKKVGETAGPLRYDLNQIPYDYTVEVRNRFKGLDLIECLMNYGLRFMT